MGFLQPWHVIVIIIVALLIFGPKRLPEIGKGLAKAIQDFKSGMRDGITGPDEGSSAATCATDKPATLA